MFITGHDYIADGDFELAYSPLNPVAETPNSTRDNLSTYCKFKVDFARAYVGESQVLELQEQKSPFDLGRYPEEGFLNPVPAEHVIIFDEVLPVEIQIYDLSGVLIESRTLTQQAMNVSDYRPGTYVVKILHTDTQEVTVKRFIKH